MPESILKYKNKSFVLQHYGEEDHISRGLIQGKWYELPLLQYIEKHAPKQGLYVDVGAFIGTHTIFFASFCDVEVYAFEPNRKSFALLEENANGNKPFEFLPLLFNNGIGENKKGKFVASPTNQGNCVFQQSDAGVQLYNHQAITRIFETENVSLIKIDVEGMQDEVFNAFLPTIERCRPWLAIECTKGQAQNYLETLDGYKLVKWFGATPVALLIPEA